MSDDEWDSIDIDDRIKKDEISRKKQEIQENIWKNLSNGDQVGENFSNLTLDESSTRKQNVKNSNKRKETKSFSENEYYQPFPHKAIQKLRSYAENNSKLPQLFFETFGKFERYLETHRVQLTSEIIVDLLIVNVALLDLPLKSHVDLLLDELIKISDFWQEMRTFIEDFFENRSDDKEFLLKVDMNRFFDNIQYLLRSLLMRNRFLEAIEVFYNQIIDIMKKYPQNVWNCAEKIQKLQIECKENQDLFDQYDIYPTLEDLKGKQYLKTEMLKSGKYENVQQYLRINLPLLQEDFVSNLRSYLKMAEKIDINSNAAVQFNNCNIYPKVEIVKTDISKDHAFIIHIKSGMKNMKNEFFKGQMLCLSSTKDFTDLIIATVVHRMTENKITVKIVRTEFIDEIFDRQLVMIEPSSAYFETYRCTYEYLRELNDHNFPFKHKILKLDKTEKVPDYLMNIERNDYNFNVNGKSKLEKKQAEAIQKAMNSDFSLIQGPPGTGKSFIGLEILSILMKITKENIFILSQTNDALDKFLLGIKEKLTNQKVVRFGKQSKCEGIKEFVKDFDQNEEIKKYVGKLHFNYKQKAEKLDHEGKFDEIFKSYCILTELKHEARQLGKYMSYENNRIFGMTTSFAVQQSTLIQLLKPGIVIFEEASEVLESNVIASLTKHTKHVIMIGDHKQLRPQTSSHELRKYCNFDVSLFERMVMNDISYITLDVQRRMRPEISELVRMTIYPNLKDSEAVLSRPNVNGMSVNLFCLNHVSPEESRGSSFINRFEVNEVANLVKRLIRSKVKPSQITILTAYAAQEKLIIDEIKRISQVQIRVAILDKYQGEDSDVIILSLVRSNKNNDIGFLSKNNRIAVILSRAKVGFYIIGNMECFSNNNQKWKLIHEHFIKNNMIGDSFP